MIWIVTTKENAMMGYVYVSLDGKNKQIVQVHNCEKDNQIFNILATLYLFLLQIFTAQMTVIVMKKDLATSIWEIVLVMKAGMVSLTAHFVSLESVFHFRKFLFQLQHPLASQNLFCLYLVLKSDKISPITFSLISRRNT